jgi:SAM-dependent methyltransferase
VISDALLAMARCPDCGGPIVGRDDRYVCRDCARTVGRRGDRFLDLRPAASFAEQTKYLDEALHADARHETVSPPLLSAKIRNDMLRRFLQPSTGDRIVDLGCGSGRVLVWNRSTGASAVGVDVSPFFAHDALDTVDLALADLRRLPFDAGTFSKAYSLDVLEHLSPDALGEMLREAARVLKPGGALFVYSHVRKNSPLALGLKAINSTARALERAGLVDLRQERLRKSDHQNPLVDHDDLARTVERAGFRIERIRYYTPLVGGFFENIVLRVGERFMTARASARSNTPPTDGADDRSAIKAARLDAKARIAQGGPLYAALRSATWLMKLDVALFGRIRSGPFFALLVKTR